MEEVSYSNDTDTIAANLNEADVLLRNFLFSVNNAHCL